MKNGRRGNMTRSVTLSISKDQLQFTDYLLRITYLLKLIRLAFFKLQKVSFYRYIQVLNNKN